MKRLPTPGFRSTDGAPRENGKELFIKLLLTLAVALFIAWRQPELLTTPRFWAEEGTNFFAYASAHPWWDNLLHPQFGYYTLYNAIATSLAATVPLEYAPAVTTWLAYAVQLGVSAAVLWWRTPLLPAVWQRGVIAFAIQFLAYARIWLTTIGVQYFLCVLSFLILLGESEPSRRAPPLARQLMIAFNGLTGVLSCFLIPAFLLKWRRDRNGEQLRYALILTACLVVQTGVFTAALLGSDNGVASRLHATNPLRLVAHFIQYQFVVPVTGHTLWLNDTVSRLDARLTLLLRPLLGTTPEVCDYLVLQQLAGLALVAFLACAAVRLRRHRDTGVIVTAFVTVAICSTLFSVNSSGGPRYTYAPSVMLLIFLAASAGGAQMASLLRRTALVLLVAAVLLCDYRATMVFAYSPDWPQWRQELNRWRGNPAYQLQLWPAPFSMTLTPPGKP